MSHAKVLAAMLFAVTTVGGMIAQAADAPVTAASEIVQYRLESWKTAHVHGEQQTEQLVATLKKMRCEVKVGAHNGHSDVSYRCPKWQRLALTSHAAAHQWESWLKKYGFETQHTH